MRRLRRDNHGVTVVEYALIALLVTLLVITGATTLGLNVSTFFSKANAPFTTR
jgi:Flp pilus assembly pilin Flp